MAFTIDKGEPLVTDRCIDNSPHSYEEMKMTSGVRMNLEGYIINFYCKKCLALATIKVEI